MSDKDVDIEGLVLLTLQYGTKARTSGAYKDLMWAIRKLETAKGSAEKKLRKLQKDHKAVAAERDSLLLRVLKMWTPTDAVLDSAVVIIKLLKKERQWKRRERKLMRQIPLGESKQPKRRLPKNSQVIDDDTLTFFQRVEEAVKRIRPLTEEQRQALIGDGTQEWSGPTSKSVPACRCRYIEGQNLSWIERNDCPIHQPSP